jgi:hypothetical protein
VEDVDVRVVLCLVNDEGVRIGVILGVGVHGGCLDRGGLDTGLGRARVADDGLSGEVDGVNLG